MEETPSVILVAEDFEGSAEYYENLVRLLADRSDFEVIQMSPSEVLSWVRDIKADGIILGYFFDSGTTGIQVLEELQPNLAEGVSVVFLTAHAQDPYIHGAITSRGIDEVDIVAISLDPEQDALLLSARLVR